MVTRLKTVQFSFPTLASLVNNTLTNLTQITVYLPESSKTFRKVIAHLTFDDIITATGGTLTTKTRELRLGAAAYTSVANANTLTNSGENGSFYISTDFTSHFTTNWTGTSMTCDFRCQINQSTGTTLNLVNASVTLDITYEYDDTSATQVKTVWIPLNAPVGALATSKPGTQNDVIPNLDTYLPEATKTYRDMHIVVQGNEHRNGATTDHTITMQFDTGSTVTTGNYEGALASDRWFRYVWSVNGLFTTNATHNFFIWASVARVNHAQVWLTVTYEFDLASTTDVMNSLMLPMEIDSPMGGTTSSDYQRATRELFVQEPNVALQNLAFYAFWEQQAAIAGLNLRVGTGSFVTYTDAASQLCGGNGCMVRNDAPTGLTFARGRNSLLLDIYRTDTADLGWNVSGFWIINYTSDVHADGPGAHNHTILWNLTNTGTANTSTELTISATAPVIPETNYYMTAIGTQYSYINAGTAASGAIVSVERLAAGEGGVAWENAYKDITSTDAELGVHTMYSQMKDLFLRWPGDLGADRMDVETARRWRVQVTPVVASFHHLDLLFTYHTITFAVAGNVTGFTGTVNLNLHRANTGEKVKTTTRSGDGAYSFTWYDDTEDMFVSADDGTLFGRSTDQLAV